MALREYRCDRCHMILKREWIQTERIIKKEEIREAHGPLRVILNGDVILKYDRLCEHCSDHVRVVVVSGRQLGSVDRSRGGRKKC